MAALFLTVPASSDAQTAVADPIALDAAIRQSESLERDRKRAVVERAAQLINRIRQNLDACGDDGKLAAGNLSQAVPVPQRPSVRWNRQLDQAATRHALAMVNQGFFAHTDPSGHTVGHRVGRTGYQWRVVGENLAAGQRNIDEAVSGWLFSPGHCEVLIDARFTEFGLARVNAGTLNPFGAYWALVLAQPRALPSGQQHASAN